MSDETTNETAAPVSGAGEAGRIEYLGPVGKYHVWAIDERKAFVEWRDMLSCARWTDTGECIDDAALRPLMAFEAREAFAAAERAAAQEARP